MNNINYRRANLCVNLATMDEMPEDKFIPGQIILRNDEVFEFTQTVREKTKARRHNEKLFDGVYVSLTRMSNGHLRFNFKDIDEEEDRSRLPRLIYNEVSEALKRI